MNLGAEPCFTCTTLHAHVNTSCSLRYPCTVIQFISLFMPDFPAVQWLCNRVISTIDGAIRVLHDPFVSLLSWLLDTNDCVSTLGYDAEVYTSQCWA